MNNRHRWQLKKSKSFLELPVKQHCHSSPFAWKMGPNWPNWQCCLAGGSSVRPYSWAVTVRRQRKKTKKTGRHIFYTFLQNLFQLIVQHEAKVISHRKCIIFNAITIIRQFGKHSSAKTFLKEINVASVSAAYQLHSYWIQRRFEVAFWFLIHCLS